ncbi:MAG: NUDIX domain-containing protein [Clostridia bacterium]|nr:NUDIX domain-containing protein [Clostridia bacterium]
MSENKRKRVRAIIIENNKLASMYREREGEVYYTFPGGGLEGNETERDCVIREVYEEFGIIVKPIKKVYSYENRINIESFYLCEWVDGVFGTGQGEEFDINNKNGLYKPTFINIADIPKLPLMPPEVASAFYEDYMSNGKSLRDDEKSVN